MNIFNKVALQGLIKNRTRTVVTIIGVALALRLSVPALIGAAVVSLITILISAYIPAKKAAAMPVMECIRQTNEIKVDAKSMRPSRLSRRFLGLDETLALKNFKRNKGRYRSIILSLTFSVVLFVGSSYFKTCFVTLSNQAKVVTDFDINLDAPAMTGEDLTALCDHLKGAAGPKPFGKRDGGAAHFGMGLYSSQLLCRKHGGDLRLNNCPGATVTASFKFQGKT